MPGQNLTHSSESRNIIPPNDGATPRCHACGELATNGLATARALLSAASATTGDVRVVYAAQARGILDRLAEEVRRELAALAALEEEIARVGRASGGK